uniref:Uncharacterized protein n=1 Tax=Glossina pallidipes TaxID=7398 RepID=A0A1B0A280_GLOPL
MRVDLSEALTAHSRAFSSLYDIREQQQVYYVETESNIFKSIDSLCEAIKDAGKLKEEEKKSICAESKSISVSKLSSLSNKFRIRWFTKELFLTLENFIMLRKAFVILIIFVMI